MELVQKLSKELRKIQNKDNVEIKKIYVNRKGNRELDEYISRNLNSSDTIYGYTVENFPCEDKFKIITEELYKVCEDCSQKKMYDEKYKKYYCPMCDSRINRFKDKLYNIVD